MDESQALKLFAEADEGAALQAWERLWALNQPRLRGFLSRWLKNADDREDVVQDTFLKIWEYRPRFQNQGVAAWHGFLYRTAYHCCIDFLRDRLPLEELDEYDIPDDDLPLLGEFMDSMLEMKIMVKELYHCADVLWLELDPALSRDTHVRQLLAAQLYYLDGDSWEDVLRSLGTAPRGEPPLDRNTLDAYLSHHGVLRFLAYDQLYYPNKRLAGCLLDVAPEAIDSLMSQATAEPPTSEPPPGWSWAEVMVVLLRYRYGQTMDRILGRKDCPYSREDLSALLDRLDARMPFSSRMTALLSGLDRAPTVDARAVLADAGLWKRLAFQYCYREFLPHRDVQARTQPAAQQVGCTVTLGMLNVWLSNRRLLEELKPFYQRISVTD